MRRLHKNFYLFWPRGTITEKICAQFYCRKNIKKNNQIPNMQKIFQGQKHQTYEKFYDKKRTKNSLYLQEFY